MKVKKEVREWGPYLFLMAIITTITFVLSCVWGEEDGIKPFGAAMFMALLCWAITLRAKIEIKVKTILFSEAAFFTALSWLIAGLDYLIGVLLGLFSMILFAVATPIFLFSLAEFQKTDRTKAWVYGLAVQSIIIIVLGLFLCLFFA
ncbi:MAG: hypothetical protein PHT40_03375 [Patescibacteria group bacterium]|nr:hypothetical protein [Patescibacteria group bacterium]